MALVACPPIAMVAAYLIGAHSGLAGAAIYVVLLILCVFLAQGLSRLPAGWIDNAVRVFLRMIGSAARALLLFALVLAVLGAILFVVVRLVHFFWYL
jgi:hypothetical protein